MLDQNYPTPVNCSILIMAIWLIENNWIVINLSQISQKLVPMSPVDNKPPFFLFR